MSYSIHLQIPGEDDPVVYDHAPIPRVGDSVRVAGTTYEVEGVTHQIATRRGEPSEVQHTYVVVALAVPQGGALDWWSDLPRTTWKRSMGGSINGVPGPRLTPVDYDERVGDGMNTITMAITPENVKGLRALGIDDAMWSPAQVVTLAWRTPC